MAHYDLYASLGVSRGDSCEQLRQEITRRLQTGQTTNPGGPDELRVALAVLGSPGRRAQYDAVLDSPDAAPLTPADITTLANMPEHPTAQGYTAGQSTTAGAQTRRTSKSKFILAAVIAVVVLVAAALGFFLLRDGSDDKPASAAETTTSSSDSGSADKSSESSSTSSSANKSSESSSTNSSASSSKRTSASSSKPRKMLDEFMALDTQDDRAKWIKKHADFDRIEKIAEDYTDTNLPAAGIPSLNEFARYQAEQYTDAVDKNGTPRIKDEIFLSDENLSSSEVAEMEKMLGSDVTDAYYATLSDSNAFLFAKYGGSWNFVMYGPE